MTGSNMTNSVGICYSQTACSYEIEALFYLWEGCINHFDEQLQCYNPDQRGKSLFC